MFRMQLEGNVITKANLMASEGFEEFDKKRIAAINKAISAGIGKHLAIISHPLSRTYTGDTDRSLCGLD